MRILLLSALVGLVIGSTLFWIPQERWSGLLLSSSRDSVAFVDKSSFNGLLLYDVNLSRQAEGLEKIDPDSATQKWVEARMETNLANSPEAMDALLAELQENTPTVHTAAAYLTFANDELELRQQVESWHEGIGRSATHLAAVPFVHQERQKLGCLAVSVRKLPVFSPKLLDQQVELFFNVCAHCNTSHAGRVPPSGRSVVFTCPHCDRPFDAYAMDNIGHYKRVTNFLSNFEGPALDPPPTTQIEEMYCIWYAVATRCRYTEDLVGVDGPRDFWQTSMETFNSRNGDCEDSSILLADWLISRGIEARVATGKTNDGEGHAWCVARIDGVQYILEATALPDPDNPPIASVIGTQYRPKYLFDRDYIHFLQHKNTVVDDYWNSELWLSTRTAYEDQANIASDVPPLSSRDKRLNWRRW